jgi:hypothetical protein
MFDLDAAITAWRRQMFACGIKSPNILDELESHLRDGVDQQVRSGLSVQQAFGRADASPYLFLGEEGSMRDSGGVRANHFQWGC